MSLNTLTNIGTLICIGLAIFIIVYILKVNLKNVANKTTDKLLTSVGNSMLKIHNKNIQKTKISNKKTFANGKFYRKTTQIIFDLGLDDVTVEGYMAAIGFLAIVVSVFTFIIGHSILITIIMIPATAILAHTVAYMLASEGHFKREFAIMDAIDLIIVNLDGGIFKAVKEQLSLFSPLVQPDLKAFIDDVYEYKVPMDAALDSLAIRLGPGFYKFKEKVKEYEAKGRAGMLETFADDMNENMYRRMDLRELMDVLRECNLMFALSIGVCLFFFFTLVMGNPDIKSLVFETFIGQMVLAIDIFLIILAFAFLQKLREEKRGEDK